MRHYLVTILILSVSCIAHAQEVGDTIIVVKDEAQMKQQSGPVATVPRGNHLRVDVVNGNWYWVFWNGQKGWIHRRDVISLSQGVDYFTKAIDRSPNAGDYNNRALVWEVRGAYDKALADYNKAIQLDPKYPVPYNNRGMILAQQGSYDRAIDDFDQAIKLDENFVSAYYNRSNAHYGARDFEKAIADYGKVIELEPEDVDARNGLAWLLATCPSAEFRDGKRAVELATKACELTEWKEAGYLDTLAAGLAESGEFEKAVEREQEAISLADPAQKDRYQTRLALYQEGKPYREE